MPGNSPAKKTVAGNLLGAATCAALVLAPGIAVDVDVEVPVLEAEDEVLDEEPESEELFDDEEGDEEELSEEPNLLVPVFKLQTDLDLSLCESRQV